MALENQLRGLDWARVTSTQNFIMPCYYHVSSRREGGGFHPPTTPEDYEKVASIKYINKERVKKGKVPLLKALVYKKINDQKSPHYTKERRSKTHRNLS